LLPFLSLHSRAVGLSLEEARIVSYTAPLLAFLGPIIAGPLLDHFYSKKTKNTSTKLESNACIRVSIAIAILLSAVLYCLLLTVPHVERLAPRHSRVSFACTEQGATLLQERCNGEDTCYRYPNVKKGNIRLSGCSFDCASPPFPRSYFITDDEFAVSEKTVKVEEVTISSPSETTLPTSIEEEISGPRPDEPVLDIDKFFDTGDHSEFPVDEAEDDTGDENLDDDDDDGSGEDTSSWVSLKLSRESVGIQNMCPLCKI